MPKCMASRLKIVVTGANGQLGRCLRDQATATAFDWVWTDIDELDITSREAVATLFDREQPDWVVNCAAYTAVDKAESEPEKAELLNATAVDILASEAAKIGAAIVQISTDYVFAGNNPQPLAEDEPTGPVSVYGKTKWAGEQAAKANPKHVIIRTSWLYSVYGNNFVKTMRRLGAEKEEISVVADQWGSPTSAHDLAKAIVEIIERPEWGVFHFSNQGVTNWALFAEEIMSLSGLTCKVNHIATAQYPTAATRPEYSLLSKQKFSDTYGVMPPEWETSLAWVIEQLG